MRPDIFQRTFGNPLARIALKILDRECKEDGSAIDAALEKYVDPDKQLCPTCTLEAKIFESLIDRGAKTFDADKEEVKEVLEDPYWRRGMVSVLRGIEKQGVKKPFVPSGPFLVVWNFTKACNLKCPHCYQDAGKKAEDELSLEERLAVVDELHDNDVISIAFSGGEPLVDPDFMEVASYAADRGMAVAIATNGTLINEEKAEELAGIPLEYAEVSLDYLDPRKHDKFRGVPGSRERTAKGIQNLSEQGILTCVATFVNKDNYQDLPKFVDLSQKLGARFFSAFDFKPARRAKEITDKDTSPKEREGWLGVLAKKAIEKSKEDMFVFSTAPQFGRKTLEISEGEKSKYVAAGHYGFAPKVSGLLEFVGGCGAGRVYLALQENGDISPCVYMPDLIVGNIQEDSLEDLWENSEVLKLLRDREALAGHCGGCENKYVCGGCRARAWGYFGDLTGPDPGCINNQRYWKILKSS